MTEETPPRFRTATLSHRKPLRFRWQAAETARAAMAQAMDLPAIARLAIEGEIRPEGARDFRLEARLQAEVTQACVVTLAPVRTTVDEPVLRRYIADWTDPEGEEAEMPEDDSLEPMPDVIDLGAVAAEALALSLPPYPRAPGAALGEAVFAAPGVAPLRDEDLRPFAALARLQVRQDSGPDDGSA